MSIINQLKEKVTSYIDVHVKLFKLNFIGRTAGIFSYFMFALICLLILFCIILFLGLGLTEEFILLGFTKASSLFLTIGIYCLLLLLVILLRKNFTRLFSSIFIRVLTEGDDEDGTGEEKE